MPPDFSVERLAAVEAKLPTPYICSTDNSAGATPSFNKRLTALPPKISPAPVVSRNANNAPKQEIVPFYIINSLYKTTFDSKTSVVKRRVLSK